jgi:hypothetical protein
MLSSEFAIQTEYRFDDALDVRLWLLADTPALLTDFRFTPESGHFACNVRAARNAELAQLRQINACSEPPVVDSFLLKKNVVD